jgi:sugar transferase (PEP-CTERM/EpsH1 system associated)
MRHLLFIAHRIPYPPDKGDKIRSYHILRHLAARFKVHLGCFIDEAADERHIEPLREICEEVFCLPIGRTRRILRGVRGLALGRSITQESFSDRRMHAWVRDALKRSDITAAFAFCSAMAPYLIERPSCRRMVLDMVDVDSEKWGAYSRSVKWPLSALYRIEQRRVFELERRAGALFDHVFFVSRNEADVFLELDPELSAKVGYLENGVDLERFDPAQTLPNPFGTCEQPIVFTGAMDYRPNIDAVLWFAREVFRGVRDEHANAEFWIVGGNPPSSVRGLSRKPGIFVTGAVSDVRPYLAHAACAVAPMHIARGVQNKVLEAMAMAKPVVLTPAALEGLHALPDQDLLVAGNAGIFARRVSEVLSARWGGLGQSARAYVEREHRWAQNLSVLDDVLPDSSYPAQCTSLSTPLNAIRTTR